MKIKKNYLYGLIIIIFSGFILFFVFKRPTVEINEELAKCIGQNSKLYVKLGCHACETQEEMFGEYYQYLDVTDCFFEGDECLGITGTPTWLISDQKHTGVQSISGLKRLTGC